MKTTIYYIAEDADQGTKCELFGTREAQLARLKDIMERDLKEYEIYQSDEPDEAPAARTPLAAGRIAEAWDLWVDKLKAPPDTYDVTSQEVDIPTTQISLVEELVRTTSLTRAEFSGDGFKVTLRKRY